MISLADFHSMCAFSIRWYRQPAFLQFLKAIHFLSCAQRTAAVRVTVERCAIKAICDITPNADSDLSTKSFDDMCTSRSAHFFLQNTNLEGVKQHRMLAVLIHG